MTARYLDDAQRKWVRDWYRAIHPSDISAKLPPVLTGLGRQARAQLRRCSTIEELITESAALRLAGPLLELEAQKKYEQFKNGYAAIGMVAGVLAHVREDAPDGRGLATRLGGEQPNMSELRFTRLMRAESDEDFYRMMCRAVQLADGKADVAELADDIIAWAVERKTFYVDPASRMKSRWARDYYLPAQTRAAKQDKQNTTSENPA
ncbi:CRISPR-associated Cse2 family protein [Bordetella ansorpii]|uniref:CRISPR-associated Cse2 family protein n=1 Tax=Bordetella ansorpii TaxID=288768 RepID=A0A157SBC3_9BORD|nr:type I-E CRISPR-associated protein Cse2/CasB [Bordetella ansorpii]SAI67740.1 CRISPR-associated Cse2 family protein [Bordetella ansorpii]